VEFGQLIRTLNLEISSIESIFQLIFYLRMIELSEKTGRVISGLSGYMIEINRVTD
jgi:hypothetical protein